MAYSGRNQLFPKGTARASARPSTEPRGVNRGNTVETGDSEPPVMRIAQVAPLNECVPPSHYGGTERVVSYLTEELVRLGHEVTLFASGDAQTAARLVGACPKALWRDPRVREVLPHHVRLLELVFRDAGQFDVIHFHCDYVHFPLVLRYKVPTVTTMHGMMHPPDLWKLFEEYREVPLVSISDDQRAPIPHANWQSTVYHGLPSDLFTFNRNGGDYLAFLGRMSPEKGVDRAIEIARIAGMPLRIAGKIYPEERTYFESTIKPLLHATALQVEFVGELNQCEKNEFLGKAKALLFPIDWPEPFGLVMIEALASGTPVIAWRRGSVPEVLVDGVTGFVVESIAEAVSAVGRLDELSRRECRRIFEERFTDERMAHDYLRVYGQVARLPGSAIAGG
jgi:glycosyltransferase involved in cell wall biosynthesis